jgi:hypothetical protein
MVRTPINFDLIRWPIDIVVFVLAFGYGVTRVLDSLNPPPPPEASRLCAYACLAFFSTLVVRRYLPSETRLERHGNVPAVLWINLSLALAVVMPAIAIYYSGRAIFWILLVISSAAKSILALESRHPKEMGEPRHTHFRSKDVALFEHYLYASNPNAYALRGIPTAILLTAGGCGIVLLLRSHSFAERLTGVLIMFCSGMLYLDLSTRARISALRHARKENT